MSQSVKWVKTSWGNPTTKVCVKQGEPCGSCGRTAQDVAKRKKKKEKEKRETLPISSWRFLPKLYILSLWWVNSTHPQYISVACNDVKLKLSAELTDASTGTSKWVDLHFSQVLWKGSGQFRTVSSYLAARSFSYTRRKRRFYCFKIHFSLVK